MKKALISITIGLVATILLSVLLVGLELDSLRDRLTVVECSHDYNYDRTGRTAWYPEYHSFEDFDGRVVVYTTISDKAYIFKCWRCGNEKKKIKLSDKERKCAEEKALRDAGLD